MTDPENDHFVFSVAHGRRIYLDIVPLVIIAAFAEQSMCNDAMDI